MNGHLAVLRWARAHDCPWSFHTCKYAAEEGQLEVLQWVRENDATGEIWGENRVLYYAAGPREQEVLTWLDQVNGPLGWGIPAEEFLFGSDS